MSCSSPLIAPLLFLHFPFKLSHHWFTSRGSLQRMKQTQKFARNLSSLDENEKDFFLLHPSLCHKHSSCLTKSGDHVKEDCLPETHAKCTCLPPSPFPMAPVNNQGTTIINVSSTRVEFQETFDCIVNKETENERHSIQYDDNPRNETTLYGENTNNNKQITP